MASCWNCISWVRNNLNSGFCPHLNQETEGDDSCDFYRPSNFYKISHAIESFGKPKPTEQPAQEEVGFKRIKLELAENCCNCKHWDLGKCTYHNARTEFNATCSSFSFPDKQPEQPAPIPNDSTPISETVDHPPHYGGGIECIDYIDSLGHGEGFAIGSVLKYLHRWKQKGGVESLKKARWYLDWLIQKLEKPAPVREKTQSELFEEWMLKFKNKEAESKPLSDIEIETQAFNETATE